MRGNMRAERARKNLTAKEVSEALGLHWNQLYSWELGKVEPNTRHLLQLADFYGVSPSYLLEDDKQKKE